MAVDMSVNSSLSQLILEILIIDTSFLHLLISQEVQDGIAAISLTDELAVRGISWVWTNTDISLRNLNIIEWLQEVSVASFGNTVDNEHLLGIPLLIVVRILTIVV